jgi:hypothetical protein
MPQVIVVQERLQKQQVGRSFVLVAGCLVRAGPRRPHAALRVVLERCVSQVIRLHQLAPLLLVEPQVRRQPYSALLQIRTRLHNGER